MTAKQQILAKYPKSYCKRRSMQTDFIAYAEPSRSNIVGIGTTSGKAWDNLLCELQKQSLI